jgi:hypothetical protein
VGAQGHERPSPPAPNPPLDPGASAPWLPSHNLESTSFEFDIDWDLLSEDLFNYPFHGQFTLPQLEKSTRDDLRVVGRTNNYRPGLMGFYHFLFLYRRI